MGLEAECACRCPAGLVQVKALVETHDLILRGGYRRTLAIADLRQIEVRDGELSFIAEAERFSLTLGEDRARRWARKLTMPPPSLAAKLGIGPGAKVWVIGPLDEPVLVEAIGDHRAAGADEAALCLAVARDPQALAGVIAAHAGDAPIWLIYPKGAPRGGFGEAAVRARMRAAGYVDQKVSAVSATLTAGRYGRAAKP